MKAQFSEASRLIIRNWDIVKELRRSEAALAAELRDFLFSMEPRIKELAWWDSQWVFMRDDDGQVYITRREWRRGRDYVIWIGVEGFSPEAIFGTDAFASLYVWVSGERPQLVARLRRCLDDLDDIIGEVQTKGNSPYVVTSALRKCLPDEIDTFREVVGTPILDFFTCYAGRHAPFTEILNDEEPGEIQSGPRD